MSQKSAKSAAELERMIMAELREYPECDSAGVAVTRPGAGRKPGSKNRVTAEAQANAAATGRCQWTTCCASCATRMSMPDGVTTWLRAWLPIYTPG
jgi:hypothetical protein